MRSHHHAARSSGYLPAVDGLRAVAVLAVIVNHLDDHWLASGFLGVDVFFVISGFVITRSVRSRTGSRFGTFLLDFYHRRIRRLFPALLLTTLTAALLIQLFDPYPVPSLLAGAAGLFGASNIFLFFMAVDYFGASAELNPFSHTWSLGVEEQFYLLLPPLMYLTLRSSRAEQKRVGPFETMTGVLTICSLVAFLRTYAVNQPAAYFLMPFRFWELGVGCLLATGKHSTAPTKSARAAAWLGPLSLTATLGIFALPRDGSGTTTVGVVGSTAALLVALQSPNWATRILQQPGIVYVGQISYSLYLWHWVVICLSRWTIGIHPWSILPQLAVMFALTTATYHWVERPCRYAQFSRRPGRTVVLGVLGALAGTALLYASHRYRTPDFSGERMTSAANVELGPGYVGRSSGRSIDQCTAKKVFAKGRDLQDALEACSTNGGQPELLVVGDSHAMDLFPLADRLHHLDIADAANLYQAGDQVPNPRGASNSHFPGDLLSKLSKVWQTPPILLVRNNYSPKSVDGSLAAYANTLETWLDEASRQGIEVVYVAPSPKYAGVRKGGLCTTQWFRPRWALDPRCRAGLEEDRREQEARRRDFTDYLTQLALERRNLHVFDPFDALCGEGAFGKCSPIRDGRNMYRDSSHLTEFGSESLAEPLTRFLLAEGLLEPPPVADPGP